MADIRPQRRRALLLGLVRDDITTMARPVIAFACAACALASAPAAAAAYTPGSAEQVAWVRRAAHNFVTAELSGNGSAACAILNAPLRVTVRHRTCQQRWDARLSALLGEHGERARLHAELNAIPKAQVIVRGDQARIELPEPLMANKSPTRFRWSENCWMLED